MTLVWLLLFTNYQIPITDHRFTAIIDSYRNAARFDVTYAPASSYVGEWLSLVEHLVRDQGVGGSNPLSPTNIFKQIQAFQRPQNSRRR